MGMLRLAVWCQLYKEENYLDVPTLVEHGLISPSVVVGDFNERYEKSRRK